MKLIELKAQEAVNIKAISASCLQHEANKDNFVLVFEGFQNKIVGVQINKDQLIKLLENINLYLIEPAQDIKE